MNTIRNQPQDIKITVGAAKYKTIEKLLNQDSQDVPLLQFLLALLGLSEGKKIPLTTTELEDDTVHTFSLRTTYGRYESEYDTYFGLIAILDNTDLSYDEVIGQIAFERTDINKKKFQEMTNVKTFFEYLQGGIEVFVDNFFVYDKTPSGVVDALHEYLLSDNSKIDEIIRELILAEQE